MYNTLPPHPTLHHLRHHIPHHTIIPHHIKHYTSHHQLLQHNIPFYVAPPHSNRTTTFHIMPQISHIMHHTTASCTIQILSCPAHHTIFQITPYQPHTSHFTACNILHITLPHFASSHAQPHLAFQSHHTPFSITAPHLTSHPIPHLTTMFHMTSSFDTSTYYIPQPDHTPHTTYCMLSHSPHSTTFHPTHIPHYVV